MSTITLTRGQDVRVPFTISDVGSGLAGLRVTWSIGSALPRIPTQKLEKQSGMGVSSADVTILTMAADQITGTITIRSTDFDLLPVGGSPYQASLWVDNNLDFKMCVTPGGADVLKILEPVPVV